MAYKSILVEKDSPLPLQTAAKELAAATGAKISRVKSVDGRLGKGTIVVAGNDATAGFAPAAALLKGRELEGREWELAAGGGNGLVISGSSPRAVCRAALGWIENRHDGPGKLTVYRFAERFTMWDNSLNQWYRGSRGFDVKQHIRQLALRGFTAVELNRYADTEGWFVRNRKFPGDSYPWYLSYAPALDQFVASSLTSGLYPKNELKRNLDDLVRNAEIAESYGLKPGFVCYEPRCVNEKIFDKYPHLRGARTDHPGRSLEPRYTLDVAHPQVLEHYAEMLKKLMKKVPSLRYLVFWTNDSGSGFPFARHLYSGPNGSYLAKSKLLQDVVAGWAGALSEAGREINPEFEVMMEIGWEYTEREREVITRKLPHNVGVTHPLGAESTMKVGGRKLKTYGGYQSDRTAGLTKEFVEYDLSVGKHPYGEIFLSNWWDYEPVIGIPSPQAVMDKFGVLAELGIDKLFARGGVLSPPQCPWSINDVLFTRLIGDEPPPELGKFLLETATTWCGGSKAAATKLVEAWKCGETAQDRWPVLFWFMKGAGTTQARWLTRPLVPDITRLNMTENRAWTRKVFTLESDIGRQNLFFEGNVRIFTEKDVEWAVRVFDSRMLPMLAQTVEILDDARKKHRKLAVLRDQRDRFLGLLLLMRTYRNCLAAQAAINRWMMETGARDDYRELLSEAIDAEIKNTKDWIGHLEKSKTVFFRSAAQETPFLYSTPARDLQVRLKAMIAHRGDQPGPDFPELRDHGSYNSTWREDFTAEG